jgi:putative transcriptional regulator
MKCDSCGGAMTSKRERHAYTESGLANVVLENVEVRRCSKCDEVEVVIPRIEQLHRAIATALVHKPSRLSGAEMRFLRKEIGFSAADFAARMGVDPSTVSRWENDKDPVGALADRLVRLMVVLTPPKTAYSLDDLANIEAGEPTPLSITLRPGGDGWAAAA